ncbi:hypothetical protein [Hymenobacter sp. BRD128]
MQASGYNLQNLSIVGQEYTPKKR